MWFELMVLLFSEIAILAKTAFQVKKISRFSRTNDVTFGRFQNFPKLKTCWITWENSQKRCLFSNIARIANAVQCRN